MAGYCKAVFLDRDDTINRDVHYCRRVEDFALLPTVGTGIRSLNEAGFKVVVITNQSGIARGYFTEAMLAQIHRRMARTLREYGAHVDAIYYCPHHPDENCDCRKPKPKLAQQAIRDWYIEPAQSFFIGDRLMDVQLARAIGCHAVIVPSAVGRQELEESKIGADYVALDFASAVRWIVHHQSAVVGREAG